MAWQYNSNRVVPSDWQKRRRAVFKRDGDVCHVCSHSGADQVDHLLNVKRGGTHDLANLAPVHGGTCTTCGKRCHIDKTAIEARAGRRTTRRVPERHPGLL